MRIILTILLLTNFAFAEASYEDLKKQMQVLQEAREKAQARFNDPTHWMIRDKIIRNRMEASDSSVLNYFKMQVLQDQYPEYFDPFYDLNNSNKYVDSFND